MDTTHFRTIRSYVRRGGRMTLGQKQGIENYWSQFGLEFEHTELNFKTLFSNDHPIVLEIGFGMGESLLEQAKNQPEINFIGIEVHPPGVGRVINKLNDYKMSNVRVLKHDATEVLEHMVPNHSLHKVQLYFPDPWHKKRHHKRRIIQPDFLRLLAEKLTYDGLFHFATDWFEYHEYALKMVEDSPLFSLAPEAIQHHLASHRPKTRFEQRGLRLGHTIFDHVFSVQGQSL